MTITTEDEKAAEIARVLEAANRCGRERGYDIASTLISITRPVDGTFWQIHYASRAALRGGGMSVEVDAATAKVKRVL